MRLYYNLLILSHSWILFKKVLQNNATNKKIHFLHFGKKLYLMKVRFPIKRALPSSSTVEEKLIIKKKSRPSEKYTTWSNWTLIVFDVNFQVVNVIHKPYVINAAIVCDAIKKYLLQKLPQQWIKYSVNE